MRPDPQKLNGFHLERRGANSLYIMDEYWLVQRTWVLDARPYQEVWPAKTLLYAVYFQIAHWLGDDAVGVMRAARLQQLVLALFSLTLLYAIARAIGRSRLEGLFVLCMVLAFSSFMERIFMTRPEAIALFFTLLALWLAVRWPGRLRVCVVAGLFCGLAFLTLQKAVYFNLALGLALVGDAFVRRDVKQAVLSGAALVLGWVAAVAAYVLYFTLEGAAAPDVARQIFMGSAGNALRGHTFYSEDLRVFLAQTFLRNIPQYLICVAGWGLLLPRLFHLSGPERRAWIFSGVIALLVYLHPAPWPYNFIMAIPFLGLWAPVPLRLFAGREPPVRAAVAVVAAVVIAMSLPRNIAYLDNSNAVQNEVVEAAEALLGPEDSYADGIGMVVTRRRAGRAGWWSTHQVQSILAEAAKGEFRQIDMIVADRPKIWILSYRTLALAEVLAPYFENAYLPILPNIMIAGVRIDPGRDSVFETRWPGKYRLYTADGTPSDAALTIDGEPATGVVRVAVGRHRLSAAEGQGPLYLLPDGIALPFDLAAPRDQRPMFVKVHSF